MWQNLALLTWPLGTLVFQSIAREYLAVRREELVRFNAAAVSIQARWRAFHVSKRVKEALAKIRHDGAATAIQTNWRGGAKRRGFRKMKVAAILVQSIVRKKKAVLRRRRIVSKIDAAATYHAHDFFEYSKKRKAASTTIQRCYRKYAALQHFIACLRTKSSAAIKIQSMYRMYSAIKILSIRFKECASTESLVKPPKLAVAIYNPPPIQMVRQYNAINWIVGLSTLILCVFCYSCFGSLCHMFRLFIMMIVS